MDLSYFEMNNEEGEVVIKSRPEQKTLEDVSRVMSLGKPLAVVNKFIELAIEAEQWQWLDNYNEYLLECEAIREFNDNLPVLHQDEEGNKVLAEPKPVPIAPVRPVLMTVDEFKQSNKALLDSYNKKRGVEINGQYVSLNENNQNGIAAVLTGLTLADEFGANMFPLNFRAESAQGIVTINFEDLPSFKMFALQFMAARADFF